MKKLVPNPEYEDVQYERVYRDSKGNEIEISNPIRFRIGPDGVPVEVPSHILVDDDSKTSL